MWLLLLIAAAAFFLSFRAIPVFPARWSIFVLLCLLAVLIFCLILTLRFSKRNAIVKAVNLTAAACLCIGGIVLPYYTEKVADLFNNVSGNGIRINLYALKDSPYEEISGCGDAVFLTSLYSDKENQEFALSKITSDINAAPQTADYRAMEEAAAALYAGEGGVLIMSSAFEPVIREMEGFETFSEDTKIIGWYYREIEMPAGASGRDLTREPFTVFIGGNDQEGELSLLGRTDVNMIVTVNPKTHQVLLVNLPRDSHVENPALGNEKDKLTHLGLKGLDNTMKGIKQVLGVDMDYYVLVNFTTFLEIIMALDHIEIDNPYEFTAVDGRHFDEGHIRLDALSALMYVRERKNIPGGDFGRNLHQQIVMKAIIQKITGPEIIIHFDGLLKAIEGQFLTSLSSRQIFSLCRRQLDENASWDIISYHVEGTAGYARCASVSGTKLSVVYPDENQLKFTADAIRAVLNGQVIEQEEMPALPEGS